MQSEEYRRAQLGIAQLKSAVVGFLERTKKGATNAQIGRSLGIYGGHKGHEGHISRTILAMLEGEGVVQQNDADRTWAMRPHSGED